MKRRLIAAHTALTPHGEIRWPLVELDADGRVLSLRECRGGGAEIDAMAGVEFVNGEIAVNNGQWSMINGQ